MALDRLVPVSGTPGVVSGNTYMDAVAEEITGLWDRSRIKVGAVSGTNTITCTITPALTAGFVDGMSFVLRPVATNTGAVTLNGVAVKDGEGGTLTAGALRIGGAYDLVYVAALTALVIVGYFPATLTPGHKFLKTQVAAASSTIDFVNGVAGVVLDDTFDTYQIDISGVQPATDDSELWLRIGTGAGPTYQTASYKWTIQQRDTTGDLSRSSASDAKLIIAGGSAALKGGEVHGAWPGLEPEQLYEGRDLAVTTDFRSVLGELVSSHLGVRDLARVFPGASKGLASQSLLL